MGSFFARGCHKEMTRDTEKLPASSLEKNIEELATPCP